MSARRRNGEEVGQIKDACGVRSGDERRGGGGSPPLMVCGVPFNQQTWTQKMLSEKDAAEAKAKLEAAAASEIAKEAAALEKQNESILREISTLQKKLAANKKIIDSKNAEVRRRRRSEAEAQLRRRMNK